jgi:hypothetical protein
MDEQHTTPQAPSAPLAPFATPAPVAPAATANTGAPTLGTWALGIATPFGVLAALAVPALIQAVLH